VGVVVVADFWYPPDSGYKWLMRVLPWSRLTVCGVAANPSCVGTTYYVHKAQGGLMTLGEEPGGGYRLVR
jgi:hypothetical protein